MLKVDRIKATVGDKVIKITGNQPAASGTSAPIILWIKENEPEIFAKTHKFLWPGGFVVHKVTGSFTMEWSRGKLDMPVRDGRKTAMVGRVVQRDGHSPWRSCRRFIRPGRLSGRLRTRRRPLRGLAKGTPVVGGMADTPAAGIGTGAVMPGATCHVIGTTARPCVVLDKPVFDSRVVNCCHGVPGCWFSLGVLENAGSSIKWFRDLFGQQEVSLSALTKTNAFDYLDEQAELSPPGANGIIYLPYLNGERSPIWDPYARGVLFGLSGSHKRSDVIRAILEGVAFAFAHNIDLFENALGVKMEEVNLSGGGAKSKIWQQIHADGFRQENERREG